jgi:hypothetical protein
VKHFDEHTLELYVLKSSLVGRKKRSIERHLAACHGCRKIVEELTEFYKSLGRELPTESLSDGAVERALQRSPRAVPAFYQEPLPAQPSASTRSVAPFVYVRRHPVVSGTALFAALVALGALISLWVPRAEEKMNPSHVALNSAAQQLEVFDAHNHVLWTETSKRTAAYSSQESDLGISTNAVYDLNGDGLNEVVSTVSPLGAGHTGRDNVSFLSPTGEFLKVVKLGRSVSYSGASYDDSFATSGVAVVSGAGKPMVIVTGHHFRSPTLVASLDAQGTLLGEYWHFGRLFGPYLVSLRQSGAQYLVLIGSNDKGDAEGKDFPVALVLDPGKIRGVTEGTESSGFGYPPSDAEIYRIRFPKTDMDGALKTKPGVLLFTKAERGNEQVLIFRVCGETRNRGWGFEYVFSENMDLVEVRSQDVNERMHAELRRQGLVRGSVNAEYLENLKARVEYWNGKQWTTSKSTVSLR